MGAGVLSSVATTVSQDGPAGTTTSAKGAQMCARLRRAALPNGDHYCGTIGDKCGGTLDCGTTCPKAGWVCNHNMCKGDSTCLLLTCVASSGDNYCGAIGDGCGGTLDCGSTCPKPGWVCVDGLCKAGPIFRLCGENLHHDLGRPILRNHRRRLRQLAGLRSHLHQGRLGVPGHLCKAGQRLAACR